MIGAGALRRQQQENEIDRLAVERLEIDPAGQAGKQAEQLVELRQLAVRDRDAVADAGLAELLPLQQTLEKAALVLPGQLGCAGGKLLQRLLLAIDLERRHDGIGRDEIGERHGTLPGIRELCGRTR